MTFEIFTKKDGANARVIGTIWAPQESEARAAATSLLEPGGDKVELRGAEETREVPMQPSDLTPSRV